MVEADTLPLMASIFSQMEWVGGSDKKMIDI
jgi:hypothetical protein